MEEMDGKGGVVERIRDIIRGLSTSRWKRKRFERRRE